MGCVLMRKKYVIATSRDWFAGLASRLQASTNCEFYCIESKEDFNFKHLEKWQPRFIFLPHWSYKIPKEIYEKFECVIFHMTDLPYGRGGSPLQNLISREIYKTKLTAFRCTEAFDAGPIYLKEDLDLSKGTAFEIFKSCVPKIESMIEQIVKNEPTPQPQSGEATTFLRRTPEESEMPNLDSLKKVHDFIRMLDCPGYPQAFVRSKDLKFEFYDSKLNNDEITTKVRITKEYEK